MATLDATGAGVDIRPIRRALISVSDKAGVADFAAMLTRRGVELVSTGGTARTLREAGLAVRDVSELTGFPEMLDGRVKTLHPRVHGGILGIEEVPGHVRAMGEHGIEPIDLVCIDLYPFEATIAREGVTRTEAIEQIDIGGPAMVRSAAKNHDRVSIVTSPGQYGSVLAELEAHGGTTRALRATLAAAAFARTSEYDARIAAYLSKRDGPGGDGPGASPLPGTLSLRMERAGELRYGENPHQAAAVYRDRGFAGPTVVGVEPLHGKALSYNNLADASAALVLAMDLACTTGRVGATVMKHANPCGAASAGDARAAVDLALLGDPVAAFGGIVACSHTIDLAAAERLSARDLFLEVIVAPGFEEDALERLRERWKTTRLIPVGDAQGGSGAHIMVRTLPGGALAQEIDAMRPDPASWTLAAGPEPGEQTLAACAALVCVGRALTSNAVAVGGRSPDGAALYGAGAGQMDRVTSCRLAIQKAGDRVRSCEGGGIAASDGFFPFSDGPAILIDAGVRTIVQPGGSKRDDETIELCQREGVSLLMTGVRHFRH
ncbi:MAG: bifunctional phosphoribosylaminoimidazolecarboxamide formyltransferase/IMP cyclohydrolase [Phycisphaerales bacterium JB060]